MSEASALPLQYTDAGRYLADVNGPDWDQLTAAEHIDLMFRVDLIVNTALHTLVTVEEVWWCDFHKCGFEVGTDCWGEGGGGQDTCQGQHRYLLRFKDVQ